MLLCTFFVAGALFSCRHPVTSPVGILLDAALSGRKLFFFQYLGGAGGFNSLPACEATAQVPASLFRLSFFWGTGQDSVVFVSAESY